MYESVEGQVPVESPVDAAFGVLLEELFAGPRVTYAPVREAPTYYGGHRSVRRQHRRFVLRAGADLDDPR